MKTAVIHGPRHTSYDTVDSSIFEDDRSLVLKAAASAISRSKLYVICLLARKGGDGVQAAQVRAPYALRSVAGDAADGHVLFITDIFPNGYTGVSRGEIKGGETIVILGSGPVGLMAARSARRRGASRVIIADTQQHKLDRAKAVVSCETILWQDGAVDAVAQIRRITQGKGADVCIEAMEPDAARNTLVRRAGAMEAGSPGIIETCLGAVRAGGVVKVIGIYPTAYGNFPTGFFFDKSVVPRASRAPAHKHIDRLLQYVVTGKVQLDDIITHRLPLSQVADGFDIFKREEDNNEGLLPGP